MIALEYAKSLFELAHISEISEIDECLYVICKAFKENEDALKVLTYPNISKKNKKEFIKNIVNKCNDLLLRFFYVLIDNDKFELIYEINHEFHKLVTSKTDTVIIELTTAVELNDNQINNIKKILKKQYEGKEIEIKNIIDANVLGGFKAISDGKQIDLTLSSKLDSLKASL